MADGFSDDFFETWANQAEAENRSRLALQQKELEKHPLRFIDGVQLLKQSRSYIANIPCPTGRVVFDFSEITRSRQSFEVLLNVTLVHKTEGKMPSFEQRLDLNSQNAVATLATTLNKAYGKEQNWVLMLNKAGNALKQLIKDEKQPLTAKTELSPVEFLLFPFLQKHSANMIFADSEVGKSFLALYMAACSADQQRFFAFETHPMKTLYLDYEDDFDTFSFRLHSIGKGNSLSFPVIQEAIKYHKPDGDMVDETEIVARMVEEGRFDLVIIDAGSSATGGDPLNATPVIKLFDALEKIPCTKLIIHHEGKATEGKSDGQSVYGTTFWKARIRVGWRLSCVQESKDDSGSEKIIKMSMFKGSNLPRQESFTYKVRFHKEGITFSIIDDFAEPRETKIVNFLSDNPDSTYRNLEDATGIPRQTLQRDLQALLQKDVVKQKKEPGKTGVVVWSLL